MAFFLGYLPYIKINEVSLQIPLYSKDFYEWINSSTNGNSSFRLNAMFTIMKVFNYLLIPMVWHLRRRGIMTYYWVCNDKEDFSRAITCGSCGIMTDEPWLLNDFIENK